MSNLIEQILDDIDDQHALEESRLSSNAVLKQLVDDYQYYASMDQRLPDFNPVWTGAEIKQHIALLKPEQQLALLYDYMEGRDEKLDERRGNPDKKLKRWLLKGGAITIAVCLVMLFGAITVIAVRSGTLPSNGVVEAFLETATEITKLLFSKGGDY